MMQLAYVFVRLLLTIKMRYILIIDETSSSSIYKPVSYSEFIESSDNVSLLLITNRASGSDKLNCKEVIEIANPTANGLLEINAFRLHEKYGIESIYTKQEDLILRAAYIRQALGISGMQPQDALLFRDKELMKRRLSQKGIKTPPFQRVYSPANVLSFTREHGFPVGIAAFLMFYI